MQPLLDSINTQGSLGSVCLYLVEGGLLILVQCEYGRCLIEYEGCDITTGMLGHLGIEEGRRVGDLRLCVGGK